MKGDNLCHKFKGSHYYESTRCETEGTKRQFDIAVPNPGMLDSMLDQKLDQMLQLLQESGIPPQTPPSSRSSFSSASPSQPPTVKKAQKVGFGLDVRTFPASDLYNACNLASSFCSGTAAANGRMSQKIEYQDLAFQGLLLCRW